MSYDYQKAGLSKRFAAGLFDLILLVVLGSGIAWGASYVLDTDSKYRAAQDVYTSYAEQFGIDFDLSAEAAATMSTEAMEEYNSAYNAAMEAMNQDPEAVNTVMGYWYAVLAVVSVSIIGGHLVLEFFVPLLLKNGQTVGKKIFSVAIMRQDGVQLTNFGLFIRSMLGKCTIEVLVPAAILFMMLMGSAGIFGYLPFVLGAIQLGLLFVHPAKALLHDLMACTVAVDMGSQLIFPSLEAKIAYEQELAAEIARKAQY